MLSHKRAHVRTLRLRDAKASLSAAVEAAERGEATTITKHRRPAAGVVPVDDARRLYATGRPSFADLLMSLPEDLETRDPSPFRKPDL
jgi:antitoxin Phd